MIVNNNDNNVTMSVLSRGDVRVLSRGDVRVLSRGDVKVLFLECGLSLGLLLVTGEQCSLNWLHMFCDLHVGLEEFIFMYYFMVITKEQI